MQTTHRLSVLAGHVLANKVGTHDEVIDHNPNAGVSSSRPDLSSRLRTTSSTDKDGDMQTLISGLIAQSTRFALSARDIHYITKYCLNSSTGLLASFTWKLQLKLISRKRFLVQIQS